MAKGHPIARRAAVVLAIALAALAGFWYGAERGHQRMIAMLNTEAEGNLTYRIMALSYMRVGEPEKAIALLEEQVDSLVVSMAANGATDRGALVTAKAYRTAVPAPASRAAELEQVFAAVPTPRADQCFPPLRRLLEARGVAPK